MPYYRIYRYRLAGKSCKHIYFRGDRPFGRMEREDGGEESAEEREPGRLPENLCRARRRVRDLILCNPFDLFCTFTFNGEKFDRYNFKLCKQKLAKLFMNYKNRYAPNFRYVVIPEFHKDGGIHFHGMVSGIPMDGLTVPDKIWKRDKKTDTLELVPNTRRYVDWPYYSQKFGFFSCSPPKNYEACAWYVSKYITKALADLPEGVDMYLCSKGLNRPELVFDMDDLPMLFKPDYEDKFVMISYQPDSATVGTYIPTWYGECCADLRDPLEVPELPEPLFPRLTGKQLRMMRDGAYTDVPAPAYARV